MFGYSTLIITFNKIRRNVEYVGVFDFKYEVVTDNSILSNLYNIVSKYSKAKIVSYKLKEKDSKIVIKCKKKDKVLISRDFISLLKFDLDNFSIK